MKNHITIWCVAASTVLASCSGVGSPHVDMGSYKLVPCPASPNCVSNQSSKSARGLPTLKVVGKRSVAMDALQQVLSEQKRTRIVEKNDHYIHAEVRSALFGFIDDVEFLIDKDSRLQFRSAARTGYWDFGVNRRRMARILKLLTTRWGRVFKD